MPLDISWIRGRAFAEVSFLAPASWSFRFGKGIEIRADCAWRVVVDGHIVLSSEDHGQQFGLPQPVNAELHCRSLIVRQTIQSADVRDDTRDILILFESGARLEIVPMSSGYESWQLAGPDGTQTIAQGGGNLVTWR
jgi:hypothetical protein